MQWFRSVHGAPTHKKWLTIARKSQQPVPVVVSIVWALLDHASRQEDRGGTKGFDAEDIASYLGVDDDCVLAILATLREKGWIVDDRISSWEEHQVKRDDSSADRVKRWRERKAQQRNACVTHSNAPDTDTDTDKKHSQSEPDRFDDFWAEYPHPRNRGSKSVSRKALAGCRDLEKVFRGMRNYAAYLKTDQAYEKPCMAQTFLNQRRWEDWLEQAPSAPQATPQDPDVWEGSVLIWQQGKPWPDHYGPPPDHPETKVPPEILARHGVAS